MMETNYTYNKLPPASKIFSPPSPLIEKLLNNETPCDQSRPISIEKLLPVPAKTGSTNAAAETELLDGE